MKNQSVNQFKTISTTTENFSDLGQWKTATQVHLL
jgi:hypothetical protein